VKGVLFILLFAFCGAAHAQTLTCITSGTLTTCTDSAEQARQADRDFALALQLKAQQDQQRAAEHSPQFIWLGKAVEYGKSDPWHGYTITGAFASEAGCKAYAAAANRRTYPNKSEPSTGDLWAVCEVHRLWP
jgi:hypothetical protein